MNQIITSASFVHASPLVQKEPVVATPVTVAFGDGIGPEIMAASLKVLLTAGANIAVEPIEIGEKVYRSGNTAGIGADAWESLRRTKVFYKAPITTPQGGGYKSLNVTVRKSLGLFANVRPVASYAPYVATKHPGMDVVIVRENEEDLYAGIEHRQTDEVYQCLKLVSRQGCERIVRYAFEYAQANGRKKVTCFTKDNIMKLTDGLFHRVFDAIGAEYPEIAKDHMIIDIGAAKLAADPGRFDVIVTLNLYGDIISDIAAEVAGSVGLAPSSNIGGAGAMFEAVHGSAPDIAGKGVANPSGLLLAGVMMLQHIGQRDVAERVHNAWLKTIEDGVATADIAGSLGVPAVGTAAFADAVIARLGQKPSMLPTARYEGVGQTILISEPEPTVLAEKQLVGVDVFVHWAGWDAEALASLMQAAQNGAFELAMITNRGVKVWPGGLPETSTTDHWRCRYLARPGKQLNKAMIAELLMRLAQGGVDFIKTEHLCTFDGVAGYSLGQGQ
jgi:isocitrate dehydrogenase